MVSTEASVFRPGCLFADFFLCSNVYGQADVNDVEQRAQQQRVTYYGIKSGNCKRCIVERAADFHVIEDC